MLPPLHRNGDLPPGVHCTDWTEVAHTFGTGSIARTVALATLEHLHDLAARTGCLRRFYVFGSFVSKAPEPRDVDIVLVMSTDFKVEASPPECRTVFAHADAQARYGASVFWIREGLLVDAAFQDFLLGFQTKRDGTLRGILEIA